MKRILSIILVLAMTLSLCSTAFAAEPVVYGEAGEVGTVSDIDLAKEVYNSLSPEAKVIFDDALASDLELLEFHKTYVDPNCSIKYTQNYSVRSMTATADPMAILNAEFIAMQIPQAVKYVLEAVGAGMIAAAGDGPLLAGDILLAAATVSAVVVIAANWNEVAPKWNGIVNAFKKAFAASASNVVSAFQTLFDNIQKTLAKQPSVTVSGQTATINGVKYNCKTKADSLTKEQQKNKKYFPAVLYKGTVYVDALHSLSNAEAKLFVYANRSDLGIWATSESSARGLCGGNTAIWHNTHSSSEGYFFHYHHPSYKKFHCWYL